jgi:hypothetical protein
MADKEMTTVKKRVKRKRGLPAIGLIVVMGAIATGSWYAGFFVQGLFNVQVHQLLDLPGTVPSAVNVPPPPPEVVHLN